MIKITKRFKGAWFQRHVNDPYVKASVQQNYRARSAFKLLQIQEKHKLIKTGQCVVDLGCRPGSWCQIAQEIVGPTGLVIGVDILPDFKPLPNVTFIQGDIQDPLTIQNIHSALNNRKPDIILSDMSPNLSGIKIRDQANALKLMNVCLDFVDQNLSSGSFICKFFMGTDWRETQRRFEGLFEKTILFKPDSSRKQSAEIYFIGIERKKQK